MTFDEAAQQIALQIADLIIRKHADYSSANLLEFGEKGIVVRVSDKVHRLKTLVWESREPKNETIQDTWQDLAGYAILAIMLREKVFELPLRGDDG